MGMPRRVEYPHRGWKTAKSLCKCRNVYGELPGRAFVASSCYSQCCVNQTEFRPQLAATAMESTGEAVR